MWQQVADHAPKGKLHELSILNGKLLQWTEQVHRIEHHLESIEGTHKLTAAQKRKVSAQRAELKKLRETIGEVAQKREAVFESIKERNVPEDPHPLLERYATEASGAFKQGFFHNRNLMEKCLLRAQQHLKTGKRAAYFDTLQEATYALDLLRNREDRCLWQGRLLTLKSLGSKILT